MYAQAFAIIVIFCKQYFRNHLFLFSFMKYIGNVVMMLHNAHTYTWCIAPTRKYIICMFVTENLHAIIRDNRYNTFNFQKCAQVSSVSFYVCCSTPIDVNDADYTPDTSNTCAYSCSPANIVVGYRFCHLIIYHV